MNSGVDSSLERTNLIFIYDTPQVNVILFMSFAFGSVFACFFSHFHQLMITDSGLKQRNRGVYKLLRVTPMKIFSFIIALTLAWTVVSLAVATILLIGGLVLFGIRMQFGTLLIFYVTLVTATICFTLISFVVANISKNEGQASIYSNIFAMPMLFLSSAFYSLDTAPTWIKTLSRLNPFSHFISGLHSTIVFDLRGAAANLFILLAFGVLALIAAILTFRWDSD
jgi:ABC-2 type transport system permease protein